MEQDVNQVPVAKSDSISDATYVAQILHDAGAHRVVAIDVSGVSSFADAFVIADATSQAQLRGLRRRVAEALDELQLSVARMPRRDDESGWLLADAGSIVVHLFLGEARAFYDLEGLWYDATTIVSFETPDSEPLRG